MKRIKKYALILFSILLLISCEEGVMQKEMKEFNNEMFGDQIKADEIKIKALYKGKRNEIIKYLEETYKAEYTNSSIGYFGEKQWVEIHFHNPPEEFGKDERREAAEYVYNNINKEELSNYFELRVVITTEKGLFFVESNSQNIIYSFDDL